MNDQSETERSSATEHWFGLDRLRLSNEEHAVDVTIGSEAHWDRSHLRRLRQSGDLPGMVPIIDSDFSADGKPFAVTPVVDSPTIASLVASGDLEWTDGAGITEAAARAAHEAHLRGLFHGALSPDDVHVIGDDVAIGGIGLGLGGTPPPERLDWVAPEVRDGADPTERSDVFSLGKILESSLGEAVDTVPRSIRRLIMWSSSDTPEARPPSAMEFASILAEGLGEDRQTYGPAFIPTAGMNELASRATSAVSNHTPSETAQSTASGIGAGAAAAGLASFGAAALMGDDDPDIADDGFSVSSTDVDESDPGVDLDELDTDHDAPAEEAAPIDEAAPEPIEVVAAETGEVAGVLDAPEAEEAFAAPAAAQTIDLDETYLPKKRRNRAGLIIGAILGLGLAFIAWGILTSGDDEVTTENGPADTADTADSDGTTATTADTATTAETAEATATSATEETTDSSVGEAENTTDGSSTDEATANGSDSTTSDGTTTDETSSDSTSSDSTGSDSTGSDDTVESATPVPLAEGPISADQAGIQVLHGVPGAEVDVYVNGQAIATGFKAGMIAGPIAMDAGEYEVSLFPATDLAPASASDRSDEPLFTDMVPVAEGAASVVAHLDASGQVAVSPFVEQLSSVDPGQGRVMIRHLMATEDANAAVGGEIIGSLAPGEEAAVEVDAGSVLVEILGQDGEVLSTATVAVDDGELVSLSAIGSPADSSAELVIQRYSGLSTAPVAVPTGDSGLLDLGDDDTGLHLTYGLMAVLAASGGVVALRRRRSLR